MRVRKTTVSAREMTESAVMPAAMIDSRDFLAAKRRAEQTILLPPGPKTLSPAQQGIL
jgi:hypothetical protein